MQRLEGLLRKAVQDYEMIAPGDRVCVGVSGGKDSVALTVALGHLRRYLGVPFEVIAARGTARCRAGTWLQQSGAGAPPG